MQRACKVVGEKVFKRLTEFSTSVHAQKIEDLPSRLFS